MNIIELIAGLIVELVGAGVGVYYGYKWGVKQEREMRYERDIEEKKTYCKFNFK